MNKTLARTFCLAMTLPSLALGADGLRESIAEDYAARLSPLFIHFHQNPELPNFEFETAKRLAAEIRALGFEVTGDERYREAAVRAGAEPVTMSRALARSLCLGAAPALSAAVGSANPSLFRRRLERLSGPWRKTPMYRHRVTLAAALQAAGLVDTLKGDGPFTVFAPTDAAFAALPEGTVENLLKPENRDQLVAILTYHVVPGKVKAKDVVKLDQAQHGFFTLASLLTATRILNSTWCRRSRSIPASTRW